MVFMLSLIKAYAYDFEVDGIYYSVLSLEDMTCKVVAGDEKYVGDIVIPAEVTYNTQQFTVTSIGENACKGNCQSVLPDNW